MPGKVTLVRIDQKLDDLVLEFRGLEINKRLTVLEQWKSYVAGIVAATTAIAASVSFLAGRIFR